MSLDAELTLDDEEWKRILEHLKRKLKVIAGGGGAAKKKLANSLGLVVYRDLIDHFEKERGPKGRWKKWSDVYKEHLQEIGRANNKILQFDGKLRQSFTPGNSRMVDEGILFYNPAKTVTGFPYAYAHDTGGPKLPQRKFMWLSGDAMAIMSEKLLSWIEED